MTNTNTFRTIAKDAIIKIEKDMYNRDLEHKDIEVVFMSYVLGQMKATFVVPVKNFGRYYEVSLNNLTQRMYIDEYNKVGETVIDLNEDLQ